MRDEDVQRGATRPHRTPALPAHRWLLVPDGLIPTTAIIEPALRAAVAPGNVHVALPDQVDIESLFRNRIIFSRLCEPRFSWLPSWMTRHGARYAYYLDDNIWEYRSASAVGAYYSRPAVLQTLGRFLANAACVLVSSEYLARVVRERYPSASVALVTAPFDFSQLPPRQHHRSGPLRIGYAGTERGGAFKPVVQAISEALALRPGGFAFEFIGHAPEGLDGLDGVASFPPILDYRQFLAFKASRGWDAGLAPLGDDTFSRAKTNNKYREYGALGIAGIYSDVSPYHDCVKSGVDGLLVPNSADAWLQAFLRLADDRAACVRIGQQAHDNVWERHRVDVAAESWRTALDLAALRPARPGNGACIEARAGHLLAGLVARGSAYLTILASHGPVALARHLLLRLGVRLRTTRS